MVRNAECGLQDSLRADRDLVLAAARMDGLALAYARGDLQSDRELVLAALRTASSRASAATLYCQLPSKPRSFDTLKA